MTITVPDSYRGYCSDSAVQRAVDHLLAEEEKSSRAHPAALVDDWGDMPNYYRAVLSAQQVRCEYAIFLIELWNEVWQSALMGRGVVMTPSTVQESHRKQRNDIRTVWAGWCFARCFELPGDLSLALGTRADYRSVMLWMDLRDQEVPLLESAAGWPSAEDGDFGRNSERVPWSSGDGQFDVAKLVSAAKEAAVAVGNVLDKRG